LCYGFVLAGEEEERPSFMPEDDEDWDFEEWIAELEGVKYPGPYTDENKPKFPAYWEAKDEANKRVGISLVYYCSWEYPMFILAIKESEHKVARGYTESLGQAIEAPTEWRKRLKEFCERTSTEFKEPEWLLSSLYG
jgi:hypothetical protein